MKHIIRTLFGIALVLCGVGGTYFCALVAIQSSVWTMWLVAGLGILVILLGLVIVAGQRVRDVLHDIFVGLT
jgi:hypothetical protein